MLPITLYCCVRFYRATKNLHSLVMAIENKEDARGIILSITQAAEAFGEEVDSEYRLLEAIDILMPLF